MKVNKDFPDENQLRNVYKHWFIHIKKLYSTSVA